LTILSDCRGKQLRGANNLYKAKERAAVSYRRWRDDRRGKNWMSAMGILFIVMAGIITIRDLLLFSQLYTVGFFLDNFTNSAITNEKFVIGMLAGGGILLYWGYFKKKEDYGPPDEHERRRFDYR
jgi:hypothetical protein